MDELEIFQFEPFLNEKLRESGMSLKRLAEATGISLRHLENLQKGNFQRLPSAPYVYAYLKKIGDVLGFDAETWWDHFKKRGLVKSSGASDSLPKNRFERESAQKYIWLGIVVVGVIAYLVFRLPKIFGVPGSEIFYPAEQPPTVNSAEVILSGKTSDAGQLFINSESVTLAESGAWEKQVLLQPGLNTFEITAKKFLGRENKIVRQIFYELVSAESGPTMTEETTNTTTLPSEL